MNQFKKAKNRLIEQGHDIENVSDLQKTGIKEPITEEKTEEIVSISKPEVINEQEKEQVDLLPTIEKETKKEDEINPIIEPIKETYVEKIPTPIPIKKEDEYIEEQPKKVEQLEQAPKSNSKKVPNIFIQKEESKSVRKSLVLKPSSVKKAENYCIKNGGSFNELVQHLLDDFIETYGL